MKLRGQLMQKTKSLLAAAAIAVLVAGCASTTEPSESPAGALSGEITVWSWDVAAAGLTRIAADFEAQNEGTKINVVDVGYDNAYDKISVGLSAGSGLPDLITVETEVLPGYIESFPGSFVDVSGLLGDEVQNFDPSKIGAGSDATGALFGIPWDSGTTALYVRTDYVAEAGVDTSTIVTWEDFLALSEEVYAATGKTAFDTDLSTGAMFLQMMQQQGAGIFDASGNIAVNSPEGVRALELLQSFNEKGLINNVVGWDERVSSAVNGVSAFSPNAVWWSGTLKGDAPDLSGKWAIQPLPAFEPGGARASNNGGSSLVIPTQSKNPDLAFAFAKFALANVDNQNSMSFTEGLFPSYLPALADPKYSEPDEYFGGQAAMQVFAELTAEIPPTFFTGDYAKAAEIVANATIAAILNGDDAKTALDKAAEEISLATGRDIS
jgi:lactose/L-arabinose transport system substrate-binding protein